MERMAIFSENRVHRLELTRGWDASKPRIGWIGLNPSTASGEVDDPTTLRIVDFTKRAGGGSFVLYNLFAYCATDPNELILAWQRGEDIWGDAAGALGLMGAGLMRCSKVVAAWGARGGVIPERLVTIRRDVSQKLYCLGKTKLGQPRHPLYLKANTPLELL